MKSVSISFNSWVDNSFPFFFGCFPTAITSEGLLNACYFFCLFINHKAAPYVMRTVRDDGTESFKGYCMDLLDELARILKFTYEVYTSPDGLYGAETENGSWNGMIGELIRKV